MTSSLPARAFAWLLLCMGLSGCAGTIHGAAKVAISMKECPALTNLVLDNAFDWHGTLGIEAGDGATLKAGIQAGKQIEATANEFDAKLKTTCSALAENLGTPLAPDNALTGDQACVQASRLMADAKAKLGSEAKVVSQSVTQCLPDCSTACNPAAPEGACAKSIATVTVSGTTDEEAAARYHDALEIFVNSLLMIRDSASNARALIANARSAVELGLVTGHAVSDGDVASAASAALCILPPLIAAKQNLSALRRDVRITIELARSAGLLLKRPSDDDDDETPAPPSKDRFAPKLVPPLTSERLVNLFAFPDGGIAAQTHAGVIALPGGEMLLRTVPEQRLEWSIGIGAASPGTTYCAVTTGRRVACIRTQAVFSDNKLQGTELLLMDTIGGTRVVASVNDKGSLAPDGLAFTAAGELVYAYTQSEQRGNQLFTFARVNRNGAESALPFLPSGGALEDLGGGGRANPPITFFEFNGRLQMMFRDGRTLLLAPYDHPNAVATVAELSAYDARPVVGSDNTLYVFYYETKSRTARVTSSTDGVHFSGSIVDTRESGWQLEALPTDTGAMVVYYYFRSPSDKGLRAADLSNGKLVHQRILVMREDRWNAGWHLHLVQDRTQAAQGTLLSYLSNVEGEDRVWARFDSPTNLLSGPKIGADADGYKNWFVQLGAGVWYTWWHLKSPAPSAGEVDGAKIGATTYDVTPALLLSANLEARWGPVDVGLSYAQNYLDSASKKLGESTRLLTGSIKIEDLLPGHDIKAEGVWGRYHGDAQRDVSDAAVPPDTATTTTERMALDTSYVDVHLFALNQWRIKYGLGFSSYSIPAPIFAYSAAAKQLHYDFAGSALRDTRFNNIDLAVGYSKLDYAAKYENRYFGPMFDVTLAGGISLISFNAIATPEGNLSDGLGLHFRGNAMLGWLWMQRFNSLGGLGFYVRPTYAIEGSFAGGAISRPEDRKSDKADKADKQAAFEVLSLRHGPWLDAGIIW
ncbi:MAG TPA: hypothetical protein VER96_41935 [Polyangiaceae bacterium]|nr:hypothetical protein [Polyangiaceae bacterium]